MSNSPSARWHQARVELQAMVTARPFLTLVRRLPPESQEGLSDFACNRNVSPFRLASFRAPQYFTISGMLRVRPETS